MAATGLLLKDYPSKTQAIRLLDIAVIGPLMIYGGMKIGSTKTKKAPVLRGALIFFGVTTIAYNLWNFYRVLQASEEK